MPWPENCLPVRKQSDFILDAFDRAWASTGLDSLCSKLCISSDNEVFFIYLIAVIDLILLIKFLYKIRC